jgi:short-subunit dehydrogenase
MNNKLKKPGTAVITGASAGLGRIYADRLAKRGYDLLLVARRGELLDVLAQSLGASYGVKVNTMVADLGDAQNLDAVAQAISSDERITMLVNNAGTATLSTIAKSTQAGTAAMISINITALTRLSIVALAAFKERDEGTIINLGSVLGFHTTPLSAVYSGTKSFVLSFTRGLQDEAAGTHVRVQLVLPATTATEIWDVAGVPLSALDPAIIMTLGDCVDAALAGLDRGEAITMPSVQDLSLLTAYDSARQKLYSGSRTGQPASRYTHAA